MDRDSLFPDHAVEHSVQEPSSITQKIHRLAQKYAAFIKPEAKKFFVPIAAFAIAWMSLAHAMDLERTSSKEEVIFSKEQLVRATADSCKNIEGNERAKIRAPKITSSQNQNFFSANGWFWIESPSNGSQVFRCSPSEKPPFNWKPLGFGLNGFQSMLDQIPKKAVPKIHNFVRLDPLEIRY